MKLKDSNIASDRKGIAKIERKLGIQTDGKKLLWTKKGYHFYDPTEYTILDRLFQLYPFGEKDILIDFGCGSGRVLFYAALKGCKKAIGIEANELMYGKLLENIEQNKWKDHICSVYGAAEKYEIPKTANRFFFFNPFSITYFKQVYQNINASILKYPRENYLFLYNCTPAYTRFLKKQPELEWVDYWSYRKYGRGNVRIVRIQPDTLELNSL